MIEGRSRLGGKRKVSEWTRNWSKDSKETGILCEMNDVLILEGEQKVGIVEVSRCRRIAEGGDDG
jgi:hypothetical protein